MTSTPTQLDLSTDVKVSDEQTRCVACGHDVVDHDAISDRYCRATQAQALARGCICQPRPA